MLEVLHDQNSTRYITYSFGTTQNFETHKKVNVQLDFIGNHFVSVVAY